MKTGWLPAGPFALLALIATVGPGRAAPLPVLDDKPLLQVDPGGPSAAVTALAFSPDGKTLYGAGLDKVVHVWRLREGGFVLEKTFRVPIGPATGGAINALVVSPDGDWLAVAGRAPMRGETGFQRSGVIVEAAALRPEQLEDAGLIYLFPTTGPAAGKVLRGHRGEVRALAFAPGRAGKPPLLVSTATEREGARRYGGLRLWNVETGKLLAERNDLPTRVEPPPGLAVWHTGPKPEQVRVAVAWPEEEDKEKVRLRLWDPTPGAAEPVERWEADRYTRPLTLVEKDGDARLLLGGLGPAEGRLRVWQFGDKVTSQTVATFPPQGKVYFVPDAVAAVSADADGVTGYAAVILRPTTDEDNRLALIDLAKQNVVTTAPLPDSDRVHLPVLAAVPRGRFVAVADAADHSVKLFAVADLLRGKTAPAQVLAGNGVTPRRAAFVDKGRGLWLNEDARAKPLSGGLYFDFDKGRLRRNEGADLTTDAPALGDWSWSVDKDRKAVRVRQGDKTFPAVVLKDKEVVTAVALRPANPAGPALLAVALTDRDNARTLILLCRPEDGTPFRLLIGHLQDVRQLAFSASRQLLASVAGDQTVCVWGLTDLDKAVGQVPGLGIADADGKAVVHLVAEGSDAARAGLAKGDVLEAVGAPGGEPRPVQGAADFLFAMGSRRPGDRLDVKVNGKRDPVSLTVGRGADGWKPLFSLFLLRAGAEPAWVGWSPAGPYDASGDPAEACVGWHSNTGDPAAPVAFVRGSEHRREYYRRGILGLLAEEADLGRALKRDDARRTPPEPALQPRRPDNAVYTRQDDVFLIREAVPALRVGINADYPLTDAHVLKWSVRRADGGNVTGAEAEASGTARRDGSEWEADLSRMTWRAGVYEVRFSLYPGPDAKSVAAKSLTFRFQPPAPTLTLGVGGKKVSTREQAPLKVMDDKLTLDVVLGGAPGRKVDVSFGRWVNGREQDGPKPLTVEAGTHPQEFTLGKGVNRLVVRALNEGALTGHEAEETAVAVVWVRYDVPNELPPRFTVLKLEPAAELKRIEKKDVWVIDRSRVRLDVRVEADGALVQADWTARAADLTSALPEQNAGKTLDFHVDLDLKAGEVVPLRLRAKSKNSDVNTADLAVVFQPPLPILTADALKSPDFLGPKATLTGTVRAMTDDPFDVVIRVAPEQGSAKEVQEFKADVDREKSAWRAEVTLAPGRNKVEAFVRNKWRGEEKVEAVNLVLRYRRPPRIVEAKAVTAVETAVVDLPLGVASPAGMPLRAIVIDGHRYRDFKATAGEEKEGWVTWQVVVPRVPVGDEGRKLDRLRVVAANDDGPEEREALVKETVVDVTHKRIPKAADARFLLPKEVNEPRPRCLVPFRVDSDSPLVSVEVRRGDEVLYRADPKKAQKEGERYVLEAKPELNLNVGLNNLDLVALNAGGRSGGAVVVNVLPPSVRVLVDRIELRPEKGELQKALEPVAGAGDEVKFPEAPGSLVWVVGRVVWSDPEAKQLDSRDLNVVALVRGCRQFPVALGPRGRGENAGVRGFEAPLVLTDADNSVKIELKENRGDAEKAVGQQVLSRGVFRLACAVPAKEQRLHLLIVGVNATDGASLTKRVLDTLGAKQRPPGLQGEFKTDAFQRCILYRVLIGEVERGKVEAQLVEINKEIARLRRESKWLNDVILIYYQGEDVVKGGERWLKTSRNLQYPDVAPETYAIPCRDLPRAAGAQLLLLNVVGTPEGGEAGVGWGGDPDIGLLRYARSDAPAGQNADLLLPQLEKSLRAESRLGNVVKHLNDLLKQDQKLSPLVVLDRDQAERIVSEPAR